MSCTRRQLNSTQPNWVSFCLSLTFSRSPFLSLFLSLLVCLFVDQCLFCILFGAINSRQATNKSSHCHWLLFLVLKIILLLLLLLFLLQLLPACHCNMSLEYTQAHTHTHTRTLQQQKLRLKVSPLHLNARLCRCCSPVLLLSCCPFF